MKRKLVWAGVGLLLLLFLLAGGLWIFRNRILNRVAKEKLTEYEACIMSLKPRVTDALEKGQNDGTLSFEWTPDEAMAIATSPSLTFFLSSILSLSTIPVEKPARSYSSSL